MTETMPRSRNKFALLLLLALLQCFAPLLHAHVYGFSSASGVHIDGVDVLFAAHSGEPAFQVGPDDVPAIAMPQEFRHKDRLTLPDAGQTVLTAPAAPLAAALLQFQFPAPAALIAFPGGPPVYSQPFSRAPPPGLI